MTHHLEPVPDPTDGLDDDPGWEASEDDLVIPPRRPAWWRWVAIVVVMALVVATPVAYGLYLLLR